MCVLKMVNGNATLPQAIAKIQNEYVYSGIYSILSMFILE